MTITAIASGDPTLLRRPTYAVTAVDHALVAIELLAHRPVVRLTELAAELDIGRATAHRLLQTLVYRGFAVQNPDRSYAAGPALSGGRPADDPRQLRTWFRPHLEAVGRTLGETVHLKVLVGIEAVCLDSVEGSRPLRTEGARGEHFPAEFVSGGLALLALLPAKELHRRYAGRPADSLAGLERALATTRRRGFGLVIGEGKAGITSVARLVLNADGRPLAAVSSSAPTMRLSRAQILRTATALQAAADAARRAGTEPAGVRPHPLTSGQAG